MCNALTVLHDLDAITQLDIAVIALGHRNLLAIVALHRDLDAPPGAALTVRVAAVLVTLPTALVTVTVNAAPLSAAAVAGVV